MYSILCIDDDPILLKLLTEYLTRSGFDVRGAANGAAGLRMFEANPVDLILTDLRMPVISGFEVLDHIIMTSPETPVIVISGTQTVQDAVEAMKAGAWDYITKPIESFTLLELSIGKAFERARLLRENKRYRENLEEEVESRTRELSAEIRERKSLESALRESLAEKEILLREIHHRVKNNLQIISSLLSLQTARIDDGQYKSIFVQCQNRIKTMAIVHEELYESEDFSKISFKSYIRTLVSYLSGVYDLSGRHIRIIIDAEDLQLPIGSAIPCGLIMNELVTNAYKHAFKNGEDGIIRIMVKQTDGMYPFRRIHLSVSDNGSGLPEDFNTGKRMSLGMQLISTLVAQIRGELTISSEGGTTFTLLFQPEQQKEAAAEPAKTRDTAAVQS